MSLPLKKCEEWLAGLYSRVMRIKKWKILESYMVEKVSDE